MPDWRASMQQTFEYYVVDPGTWKDSKLLNCVTSCTISRDATVETLGSATIDVTEPIGECYVRVYLVTLQNGITEKHPLGTFLVQTPGESFDGRVHAYSVDAYTPLIELKENPPPIGYSLLKGYNIMDNAYRICRERVRAPVAMAVCDKKLNFDFVANTDDTWASFVLDLIGNANYEIDLDDIGRVLFAPKQDTASLQPVWTFNDDGKSILDPSVSLSRDLYDIPNIVEVVYSTGAGSIYAKAVNNDPNSPTSIYSRGREIKRRITDPDLVGEATEEQIQEYANQTLRDLSSLEYTISYTHGYCPVRLRDCVRINYERAGLTGIKAKVISQSIKCQPGCPVSEKAVFTKKLWG